ncbi:hypothetical protein L596_020047 [Steinernema carpocapsae]|uniref:Uncharacterized protein n=1 Tax=Steinernema carpocapsae TaxID=34508 RepID=A0A4U5MSD8_STECR|nr:hypothetical protein L596_020047 [Steinernema carpocapsae]
MKGVEYPAHTTHAEVPKDKFIGTHQMNKQMKSSTIFIEKLPLSSAAAPDSKAIGVTDLRPPHPLKLPNPKSQTTAQRDEPTVRLRTVPDMQQ